MTPFSLRSERFSPEGSISAGAIRQNMGRSTLDPVSLLIREAVQNSWDARTDKADGSVAFSIHLGTIGAKAAETLRKSVFKEIPSDHPLTGCLGPETGLMCIRDVGTIGLNGPVFHVARHGPEDDGSRNFIRFIRDIGRGASKQLGGGTYGFGKSTFFVSSAAATVIAYTRCRDDTVGGQPEDRIIATSLWNPTEDEVYTGRHWWGEKHAEGIAPLTGQKAIELAEAIGLPRFRKAETGTVIAIISPRFVAPYERVDHDTARMLAESLTTWFWPRMIAKPDGSPWIDFRVYYENREIAVPRPEDTEPFRTMAKLIGNSHENAIPGFEEVEISSEKPKAQLGRLTMAPLQGECQPAGWKSLAIDGHALADLLDRPGGFQSRCHHVALMRSTRQVIRYLPCRAVRATGRGFAGVFMVSENEEVETAFAQSEPPAHDDWLPDSLEQERHRRFVRIALRRIREAGDQISGSVDAQAVIGRGPDLSRLSQMLGRHLPALAAYRSSKAPDGATRSTSRERNGVSLIDQGMLGLFDGRTVLTISFAVTGRIPRSGLVVAASPRVLVVGGGTEHDQDAELARPETVGWRRADGKLIRQDQLRLSEGAPAEWQVLVSVPQETQVGVSITIVNEAER